MANFQNGAPITAQTGAYNTYVGARYVPLFAGQWDNTKIYEPLTIVINEGNSYTSKQYVPAGVDISNENYWVLSANFNGQLEQVRTELTAEINNVNTELTNKISYLNTNSYLLQGGMKIAGGSHLNTFTTPGNYYCDDQEVAATILGRPTGSTVYFTLKVEFGNGSIYPSQVLRDASSGVLYYRYKSGGTTWGPWTYAAQPANTIYVGLTLPYTTPAMTPGESLLWVIDTIPDEIKDQQILAILPKESNGNTHNQSFVAVNYIKGGSCRYQCVGAGTSQTFNIVLYILYSLRNPYGYNLPNIGEGNDFRNVINFYPYGITQDDIDLINEGKEPSSMHYPIIL